MKIGDRVRILSNPKGTLWETGIIEEILAGKIKINYGLPDFPIYGLWNEWVSITDIELLEGEKNND